MVKTLLFALVGLFSFFVPRAQDASKLVTRVDGNLSLIFPGEVKRVDTMGVTLFQSVRDKITYQVVRKFRVIDEATKAGWKDAIDQAAGVYMRGARFKDFEKRAKDTVIGNTMGKFIRMTGIDHGQLMRLFIFTTLADTDMYSVQVTSFADEVATREALGWFYARIRFKGINY